MAILNFYATSGTAGWTNVANACGSTTGNYATAAPGKNISIESLFSFDFSSIPANATINSVTVKVAWLASTVSSIATLTSQGFLSGVATGSVFTNSAEPIALTTDTYTIAGLTRANLDVLTISVKATRGNSNTAVTFSLDTVLVEVDYTLPDSVAPTIVSKTITPGIYNINFVYNLSENSSSVIKVSKDQETWTTLTQTGYLASHTVNFVGLEPDTLYYYTATFADVAGNPLVDSGTARTLIDTLAPTVQSVTMYGMTHDSASMTVYLDKTGNIRVDYGLTTDFGEYVLRNGAAAFNLTLNGLEIATKYYYKVTAYNINEPANTFETAVSYFSTDGGYVIKRQVDSSGVWEKLVQVSNSTKAYDDTNLSVGSTFAYKVEKYLTNGTLAVTSNESVVVVSSSPIITIQSVSRVKISAETSYDTCEVVFSASQDLSEWEARADGTGPGSGLLVGSGTTLAAGSTASFIVENEELASGDRSYRINVYGKNLEGAWSLYG